MARTWDMMPPEVRRLYHDKLNPSLEYMDSMIRNANKPEVVAAVILKALCAKRMKIRDVGGKDVRMMPFLQRVLGENLFEMMVISSQKLPKPDWR